MLFGCRPDGGAISGGLFSAHHLRQP